MSLGALVAKDLRRELRGKDAFQAGLVLVLMFLVLDLFVAADLSDQPPLAALVLWSPLLYGAIAATGRSLAVLCLPDSQLLTLAAGAGLAAYGEAFADRAYTSTGQLVPRDQPGALISDPAISVARLKQLLRTDEVAAIDGSLVRIRARSICIHSDTRGAVQLARKLRSALEFDRIRVTPFAPPPQPRTAEPEPH